MVTPNTMRAWLEAADDGRLGPARRAGDRDILFGREESASRTYFLCEGAVEIVQRSPEGFGVVVKILVGPTLFGSVPRIFEKAYAKIRTEVEAKSLPEQRLFEFAAGVARQAAGYRQQGRPLPLWLKAKHALADRLVFQGVREEFGGRPRQFITGAAPIALEILEFFWGAGLDVYEVYGMTEATVITHANLPGQVRLGTVGRVIEPMEHRIADDGEILVRGPWVFKGYFKDAEATAAVVRDGWLHTGDIGFVDAADRLTIVDRTKDLILRGGASIYPSEIESAFAEHSAVREAAVVGRPDAYYGEEVVAIVVTTSTVSAGELDRFIRERLASYKVPRYYAFVDALPRSGSGKTLKRHLRDRLVSGEIEATDLQPDRSAH